MIWKRAVTLQALNAMGEGNMVGLLDIQFTRIGDACRSSHPPAVWFIARRGVRRAGRNPGRGGGISLYRRGTEGGRT